MQDNNGTEHHDQKIRDRAYALWEEEGRPEGREHDHWHRAHHEVTGGAGFANSENGAATPGPGSEDGGDSSREHSGGSQQQE